MTLPSNSSMQYYPNNTAANYITHLPARITLSDGEWEIALVEAHYSNTFLTVGDDAIIKLYTNEISGVSVEGNGITAQKMISIKVEPGVYKDINHLLRVLNSDIQLKPFVTFTYDIDVITGSRMVEINTRMSVRKIEMSVTLALILGFDPKATNLKKNNKAIRPANIHAALPSHMYVYCDLVEPQLVGDTVAPLLKIVNIETLSSVDGSYNYGANKVVHFTDPHYVPLVKTSFESVEIDLRNSTGDKIPFHFGTTCMKVHFRRTSSASPTSAQ